MRSKILKEQYDEFKAAALASGLVEDVVLAKSAEQVEKIIVDKDYRTLFVTISDADIYTEVDVVVFSITIVDKTNDDDDSYLASVNDGLALLRSITDTMNYQFNNEVRLNNIQVGSGVADNKLTTVVSCEFVFNVEYLPNIFTDGA